ncbi:histidine kinase [Tolypothrix sp. PCC 7601]|nr:histidine kinase [Tolypothrix sp. PCC 7601]
MRGKRRRGKGEGEKGEIIMPITNYQLPITNAPCPMPHALSNCLN